MRELITQCKIMVTEQESNHRCGLKNIGNAWFINASLQC